jgi:hypothetical protein
MSKTEQTLLKLRLHTSKKRERLDNKREKKPWKTENELEGLGQVL